MLSDENCYRQSFIEHEGPCCQYMKKNDVNK